VGFCTSGGYSHYAGTGVAIGFVPREMADGPIEAEIEILGEMCKARRLDGPLFDADGARMRGNPAT
jgi:dimethylglycine dehydrogenase